MMMKTLLRTLLIWLLPVILWLLNTEGWTLEARLLPWTHLAIVAAFLWPALALIHHGFPFLRAYASLLFGASVAGFSIVLYIFGTLGLYNSPAIILLWFFLFSVEAFFRFRFLRICATKLFFLHQTIWGLLGPWLVLLAWLSCVGLGPRGIIYPNLDCDASLVHLILPKIYLFNGGIVDAWWTRGPFLPQSQHALYSGMILFATTFGLRGDLVSNYLSLFQLIGIALLLGDIIGKRGAAMIAFALMLAFPVMRWSAGTVYMDIPNAWYIALAGFSVVLTLQALLRRNQRYAPFAFLIGLFSGMAFSVKHIAGFSLFPIFFLAFLCGLCGYIKGKIALKQAAIAAVIAAAVFFIPFMVFYARNFILTGDPLFPFLSFREPNGYYWSQESYDGFRGAITHWTQGREWYSPFLAFWSVGTDESAYSDTYQFPIGPVLFVYVILGILGLIGALFSKQLRDWRIIAPLFLCLMQFVLWYFSSPVIRYLLPTLVLVCIPPVALLWLAPKWLKGGILIPLIAASVYFQRKEHFIFYASQPPVTHAELEPHLTNRVMTGHQLNWLNTHADKAATVYSYGDACDWLYYPRAFVGDWFGLWNFSELYRAEKNREALLEFFASAGIGFILENRLSSALTPFQKIVSAAPECFYEEPEAISKHGAVFRYLSEKKECLPVETAADPRGEEIKRLSPECFAAVCHE